MARRFALVIPLVLATILCDSPPAFAQQGPWIGVKVFWKSGAKPETDKESVERAKIPFPATVTAVNGDWLWVGRAWIKKTDVVTLDKAIPYFTEEIRQNPTSPHGYNNRGSARRNLGDLDGALKDYTEAVRLDPKHATAYNNRGNAWYVKGELDNALKDYTEAIRLDPQYASAHHKRGIAWKAKGELDNALKDFTEAIGLDPKFAIAYYNRGNAWRAKGEPDNALKDYTEAIRLDPKDVDAYNVIAWLRATYPDARYRDGKAAVEHATKACEITAWKDANSLDTLAAAYAEAGDFAAAVKRQQQAVDLLIDETDKDEYRTRLALYEKKVPYRQPAK